MSRSKAISALLLAASLAACGSSGNPPGVVDTNASSMMPQSPNSLPAGADASAPMTSDTGVVGRTRVSRVRSARARRYAVRHTVRHRRVRHRAAPAAAAPSTTAQ